MHTSSHTLFLTRFKPEATTSIMETRQGTPGVGRRTAMSEFAWKKHEYAKKHCRRPEDTRHVMVIYSGGTIGMKYAPDQGGDQLVGEVHS